MNKVTVQHVVFYEVNGRVRWFVPTAEVLADMLRYDAAFINDAMPGIVAFPKFRKRGQGTWGGTPTTSRWRSFALQLKHVESDFEAQIKWSQDADWYTFKYNSNTQELERRLLIDYITEHEKR